MKCPSCDYLNREKAKFCKECGARLELVCPKCGNRLDLEAKFCDECGKEKGEKDKAKKFITQALHIFEKLGTLHEPEKARKILNELL